ncbi:uncharacterized protein LOC126888893 [Diabrotica virgifera virgifera]|uniref:Uncharacterized protein LOC114345025 n=1 Tax=Diabrotica virgifera virgifera TaxID=50390 RepID=A0A6P7GZQ3_DIAVI|nr:uncharacterized protein LOC126888893 [Diabrotica virgifera virgifera]
MSKFVVLLACLAVVGYASALECYFCDDCQGSPSSWPKRACGTVQPAAGMEWACSRIDYKSRATYKDAVDRGCAAVPKVNGKLNFNCPTTKGEPKSCAACQQDLCNSAPSIQFSFVALASVVLAVIVPKLL